MADLDNLTQLIAKAIDTPREKLPNGCYHELKEHIAQYLLANGVKLPVTCRECEYNDCCMTDFNGFGRKDFDFCPYGEWRADDENIKI